MSMSSVVSFFDGCDWSYWNTFCESMPNCFEKSIRTAVLAIWLKIRVLEDSVFDRIEERSVIDKLDAWLDDFCTRFEEHTVDWDDTYVSEIRPLVHQAIVAENEKQALRIWNRLYQTFRYVLNRHVGFDFTKLEMIMQKLQDETVKVPLEQDNVLVLLLGQTGSGMSTFLHYLLGNKLVEETRNGFQAWYLDEEASSLNNFATSVSIPNDRGESQTRFPTPVKVSVADFFESEAKMPKYLRHLSHLYIVDTPGFADTGPASSDRSIEDFVDLLSLHALTKKARHIIPLIFISSADGNHLENARSFLRNLAGIFPQLAQLILNRCLGYVFTRFQHHPINIRRIFLNLKYCLSDEEREDANFRALVDTLHELTYYDEYDDQEDDQEDENDCDVLGNEQSEDFDPEQQYAESIFVSDPAKSGDPRITKKDMRRVLRIPLEAETSVTSDDLQFNLPPAAQKHVEEGLRYHIRMVMTSIEQRNWELAVFFLKRICQLIELLQATPFHQVLENVKIDVDDSISRCCDPQLQQVLDEFEGHCLTEIDFKSLLDVLVMMQNEAPN